MSKKKSAFDFNAMPMVIKHSHLTRLYAGVQSKRLSDIDLDRYHLLLLAIDDNDEKFTQQNLADHFKTDKTFLVRMIDHLVKEGYIRREVHPRDRRKYFLKLTEKAKEDLPIIRQTVEKVEKDSFEGFSDKEQTEFKNMLNRVYSNMEKMPAEYYLMNLRRY